MKQGEVDVDIDALMEAQAVAEGTGAAGGADAADGVDKNQVLFNTYIRYVLGRCTY